MSQQNSPTYATDRRTGRVIAGYLKAGGHLQRELATHLGIDEAAVSRSTRGERRWTLDDLLGTAEFLDVPVSYLIDPDGVDPARMLEVRSSRCIHDPFEPAYADVIQLTAA